MFRPVIFICIGLLVSSCSLFKKYGKGPEGFVNKVTFVDYSGKSNFYSPLEDVLLRVDSIAYKGRGLEKIDGSDFSTHEYYLKANLRLDLNCNFIHRDNRKHKVYPTEVEFELSIINNTEDAEKLFYILLDSIYEDYSNEIDSFSYELGVFRQADDFMLFLNCDLSSNNAPFILSILDKCIILRIANHSIIEGDYVDWVPSFLTEDVIRGLQIRKAEILLRPSFSDLMDRYTFLDLYDTKKIK